MGVFSFILQQPREPAGHGHPYLGRRDAHRQAQRMGARGTSGDLSWLQDGEERKTAAGKATSCLDWAVDAHRTEAKA